MTDTSHAVLPALDACTWQSIGADDVSNYAESLAELTRAADRADSNEMLIVPVQRPSDLAGIDLTDIPVLAAIGADGEVAGVSWVTFDEDESEVIATLHGCVHPAQRRKGIGSALLAWSEAAARDAQVGQIRPIRLFIRNETLSDDARRMYTKHGFDTLFVEYLMYRELSSALPDRLVLGVTMRPWTEELIPTFYETYFASFTERPGFPNWSQAQWVDWVSGGDDFAPEESWLAYIGERPVGFLVSDIDPVSMSPRAGWITQLGSHPEARGKGVGAALMIKAMHAYRALGLDYIALTVNDNNPRAQALYRKMGLDIFRYRGKYEKRISP